MRIALLALVPLALTFLPTVQADESWLTEVATHYRNWGRVDDELRWAPFLCRMPMPSLARVSRADQGGHGRKVYFIYASDRARYLQVTSGRARSPTGSRRLPRGFTVVKEAFHPQPVAADGSFGIGTQHDLPPQGSLPTATEGLHPDRYRALPDEDGRALGPGRPAGLYVMRYVGRRRGTDRGWLYGTIDPRGTITSEGRNRECMSCHRSAPHHNRLFGLARD